MAKIILSTGNVVLREIAHAKERITIGRGSHNDIVIDDGAISAEHAVIVTVDDDAFLEDLNSTNGTQVNGQPVKKHFLRDGDVVELAGYRIAYNAMQEYPSNELTLVDGHANFLETTESLAHIQILTGPSKGRKTTLKKLLTTIGQTDMQIAAILKCQQDYVLLHVAGSTYPLLNERSIGATAAPLINGDVIDLGGVHMRFVRN